MQLAFFYPDRFFVYLLYCIIGDKSGATSVGIDPSACGICKITIAAQDDRQANQGRTRSYHNPLQWDYICQWAKNFHTKRHKTGIHETEQADAYRCG